MTIIATLGPTESPAFQAARHFDPHAELQLYPLISTVIKSFINGNADLAVIPVYNTREGEMKEYFRVMKNLEKGYWVDNVVQPIQLSLGSLDEKQDLSMLVGRGADLRQCEEFIANKFPEINMMTVADVGKAIDTIKVNSFYDRGIISTEEALKKHGFFIREREMAPHNQTRFAVLGPERTKPTGYDATAMYTVPLKDRVGLLYDILGEFTRRGISIMDFRTENDIKTQELQIYIEAEGHCDNESFTEAIACIEDQIIQEPGAIKLLGSFPRVDMRTKNIQSFGFIGTGDMSKWFAEKLKNEGYSSLISGRSTELSPEEMIPQVDVVAICVPISATPSVIEKYAPLLKDGQALVLLAGEAENAINTALSNTSHSVEVMLVHNLWGPQAINMKDKNVSVVRTARSGILCSEFEAFMYKHGADINHDTPKQHDLLMGVGQKLPTTISIALAMTLRDLSIPYNEIGSHSTLTSLYGILAMARIHTQNPRTYAEIISTMGDGRKIVKSFAENLITITELANECKIDKICEIITNNKDYLTPDFLDSRMQQSLAVDETLGKVIRR